MASGSFLTLADIASRTGTNGEELYVAEMLSQSIVMLRDMPMIEASEYWRHEGAYRTGLPQGGWRQANQGVGYFKSTTGKLIVGLGVLEAWSQIDELELVGLRDPDGTRQTEDAAFLEGMGQNIEGTLLYGNVAQTPGEFQGFAPFFNTISGAQNGVNIIDGLGTGSSNTSIWVVGWGERSVTGLYPRGSAAGLKSDDRGTTTPAYDSLGNPFRAYTMVFQHMIGLFIHDWRYVVRIANLDTTGVAGGLKGPTPPDLFTLLSTAANTLPHLSKEASGITETDAARDPSPALRPRIYCNRTVRTQFDIQGMRNKNVLLTVNDAAGKVQDFFRGIEIKVSDQILTTEARVT